MDIESFYLLLSFVHYGLQVYGTKVASCGDLKNPCTSIISLGISMGQWEVLTTTKKTSSIGFIEDKPFQLVQEACLLSVFLGAGFVVGSNTPMDRCQRSVGHDECQSDE